MSHSIDPSDFSSAEFDSQRYVLSRWREESGGSGSGGVEDALKNPVSGIEVIRGELQLHLRELKHQLIELINRDYADFINLSTNLVGVDKTLEQIRLPLHALTVSIKVSFILSFSLTSGILKVLSSCSCYSLAHMRIDHTGVLSGNH